MDITGGCDQGKYYVAFSCFILLLTILLIMYQGYGGENMEHKPFDDVTDSGYSGEREKSWWIQIGEIVKSLYLF